MKFKILGLALCIATTFTAFTASAQKVYKEGTINYSTVVMGNNIDAKLFFKNDSSSSSFKQGPATIKTITYNNGDYLAILIDVPIANMKKAAVATPAELEEAKDDEPEFTFAPTTETKTINGFNCKRVVATNAKDKKTFDAWVTNDISVPNNSLTRFFVKAGGFPIQFTTIQMGQPINISVKSIVEEKVPGDSFKIPAGYDKITLTDLKTCAADVNYFNIIFRAS